MRNATSSNHGLTPYHATLLLGNTPIKLRASEMGEETVSIEISKELYEKVKKYIEENGGFASVREFVEFVINEVLSTEEEASAGYTKEEEEKVKERLRSLGYL